MPAAGGTEPGDGRTHPPLRTFTVGPGVPPGQPSRCLVGTRPGRGLSPPVRNLTDPGARELSYNSSSTSFARTTQLRPSGRT